MHVTGNDSKLSCLKHTNISRYLESEGYFVRLDNNDNTKKRAKQITPVASYSHQASDFIRWS